MTARSPAVPVLSLDHVDVFTDRPMAGNGLTVVISPVPLEAETMLGIAQELRQFETIFLFDLGEGVARARIFTPEEELHFAGHPVLGAAAVLHHRSRAGSDHRSWTLDVSGRPLTVTTRARGDGVHEAEMDQGAPVLGPPLPRSLALELGAAVGLRADQVRDDLPTQVVSTGLPYLLVPTTSDGLAASHVAARDLPSRLAEVGAEFVYVLDPDRPEGRTWDNVGRTEDVATGSAAGPTAAYLIGHGVRRPDEPFYVQQGQFVGRPSRMRVRQDDDGSIHVGGPVARFGSGVIDLAATRLP